MINQLTEKSNDVVNLVESHAGQTIKALWKDLLCFL
jgi:hypothetical protein